MEAKWHAVYTRSRCEKKVAELLTKKKIENYCPLNLVVRQWSDRKKKVFEPLFTSYVFVRVNEKQQSELKEVPGIINLVLWLNKPAVIKEKEIQVIKEFLGENKSVCLEKTTVNVNDTVRVLSGPLMDYEGNVMTIKSTSIRISLPSLGYLMTAVVEKSNVEITSNYNMPMKNNTSYLVSYK